MNETKTGCRGRFQRQCQGSGFRARGLMPQSLTLMLPLPLSLKLMLMLMLPLGTARAQWLTQTLDLKAGWNAVFLHVDASHATIDDLVAPDPSLAVEEVWMWRPELSAQQFVDTPQSPASTDSRWSSWTRAKGPNSAMNRLIPNTAYLVKVKSDIATYAWAVKGKAVAPRYTWTTSGLNFLGFPVPQGAGPTFDSFLAKGPSEFKQAAEFYRYVGGPLGAGNPGQVFGLRTATMNRGQAYWIQSGNYFNRYFGPLEIQVSESGILNYGDTLRSIGVRVRNLTAGSVTATMRMLASETAPAGQPLVTGLPPLLVRGARKAPTTLAYDYTALAANSTMTWTLAPAGQSGSEVEVILGMDRSVNAGNPGDLLASVLRFTDSLGHSQVDVGVTAKVGVYSGLWVGSAEVTDVGQYLKKYQRDPANNPVVGTDGKYAVTNIDTSITGVPTTYPLRLIVHNPASGPARLFQRVFTGHDSQSNAILARKEATLNRNLLSEARRVSAVHLPFSEGNEGWAFNGPVVPGATAKATVTTAHDDGGTNPFVHQYHPDHDNLNATFRRTVPQGSESYAVEREITLVVTPPEDDFNSRTAAGGSLSGSYSEVVRVKGLARGAGKVDTRQFEARGLFSLTRISAVEAVKP